MYSDGKILVGKTEEGKELNLLLDKANRHGVISGASGSGKTITLKVMAESFSNMGVPVFLADIKGDLAATCLPGQTNESLEGRLSKLGIKIFIISIRCNTYHRRFVPNRGTYNSVY